MLMNRDYLNDGFRDSQFDQRVERGKNVALLDHQKNLVRHCQIFPDERTGFVGVMKGIFPAISLDE